jgi:hypothetical protein
MMVTSNFSWEQGDRSWRKLGVTLGWADMVRLVMEKKVKGYHAEIQNGEVQLLDDKGEQMPLLLLYRILQAQADLMLTHQVYTEQGLTRADALAQLSDIGKRVPELTLSLDTRPRGEDPG